MKKRPYFLLVLVLCSHSATVAGNVPGNCSSAQSGMAVWGNSLYIHTADTVLARGDLSLFAAHVQGNGTLLLTDTASRRIVAHVSSLPHLIIDNMDTVTLTGSLHLRSGLTVARGVFDTRSADFSLADSAFLHLLQGGNCLHEDTTTLYWLPILPFAPPTAQQELHLALLSPSFFNASRLPLWRRVTLPVYTASLPPAVWTRPPFPPPQIQVPVRYTLA